MMSNSTRLLRALSALLVTAIMVGCAAPAAAPAATAPGDDAAAGTGEKTKIVWWSEQVEPELEVAFQEQFVDVFNAANPTIELEVVFQQDLNTLLRTAIQAGEGPDIIQTPGPGFLLEYQKAGLVLPLDDFAAQYGWQDKILPWAYASGTLGDNLYGLPLTFESMIMLYNTQVFADLGLTPPTNRAELDATAKALKDAELLTYAYGNVGWQPTNEHLVGIYLNAFAGSDAVYEALTGTRSWEDEVFVGAIDALTQDITTNGYFAGSLEDYYSFDWDTFFGTLAAGKAGMMTIGTWGFRGAATFFAENPEGWDWAMLPALGEEVSQGFDLAIGSTASINAASKNPEAAAKVLDFLYSDSKRAASIAHIFSFGEFVVPIQFAATDFPSDVDPRIVRFLTEFAQVTGEGRYGYTTWTFWPAEAETQLWKDIELVWAGETTTADYLAKQQSLWEKARADSAAPPIPER